MKTTSGTRKHWQPMPNHGTFPPYHGTCCKGATASHCSSSNGGDSNSRSSKWVSPHLGDHNSNRDGTEAIGSPLEESGEAAVTRPTIYRDGLVCGCLPRAVESKGGAREEAGVIREQAICAVTLS